MVDRLSLTATGMTVDAALVEINRIEQLIIVGHISEAPVFAYLDDLRAFVRKYGTTEKEMSI